MGCTPSRICLRRDHARVKPQSSPFQPSCSSAQTKPPQSVEAWTEKENQKRPDTYGSDCRPSDKPKPVTTVAEIEVHSASGSAESQPTTQPDASELEIPQESIPMSTVRAQETQETGEVKRESTSPDSKASTIGGAKDDEAMDIQSVHGEDVGPSLTMDIQSVQSHGVKATALPDVQKHGEDVGPSLTIANKSLQTKSLDQIGILGKLGEGSNQLKSMSATILLTESTPHDKELAEIQPSTKEDEVQGVSHKILPLPESKESVRAVEEVHTTETITEMTVEKIDMRETTETTVEEVHTTATAEMTVEEDTTKAVEVTVNTTATTEMTVEEVQTAEMAETAEMTVEGVHTTKVTEATIATDVMVKEVHTTESMVEEVHMTDTSKMTETTVEEMQTLESAETKETTVEEVHTTETIETTGTMVEEVQTTEMMETTVEEVQTTGTTVEEVQTTEKTETTVEEVHITETTEAAETRVEEIHTAEPTEVTEATVEEVHTTKTTVMTETMVEEVHTAEITETTVWEVQTTDTQMQSQNDEKPQPATMAGEGKEKRREAMTLEGTTTVEEGDKKSRSSSSMTSQAELNTSKSSLGRTEMVEKIEIDHSTGQSQASLVEAVEKAVQPQTPVATNT